MQADTLWSNTHQCSHLCGVLCKQDLMSMGFNTAMLLLCSYCDPVRTLAHAKNEGYSVVDYRVTDLPFGVYSAEPKVAPI